MYERWNYKCVCSFFTCHLFWSFRVVDLFAITFHTHLSIAIFSRITSYLFIASFTMHPIQPLYQCTHQLWHVLEAQRLVFIVQPCSIFLVGCFALRVLDLRTVPTILEY